MAKIVGGLFGAVILCGCGITNKVDALSTLDAARVRYKRCIAGNDGSPSVCEAARQSYQGALSNAQQTHGVLTDWRYL